MNGAIEVNVFLSSVNARVNAVNTFLRPVHTERLRHRNVDEKNGSATQSARHSDRHKIKGATRQCYGDGDGVTRCEWAFKLQRPA